MNINALYIKKNRKKKGWTQTKLAEMAGVSIGTIQNYEAGGKIPKSKYLILRNLFSTIENIKDSKKQHITAKDLSIEDILFERLAERFEFRLKAIEGKQISLRKDFYMMLEKQYKFATDAKKELEHRTKSSGSS